jgi:hypothetical protein
MGTRGGGLREEIAEGLSGTRMLLGQAERTAPWRVRRRTALLREVQAAQERLSAALERQMLVLADALSAPREQRFTDAARDVWAGEEATEDG